MIEHIKITPGEYVKAQRVIRDLARQEGVPATVARANFQQLIDDAWARAWRPGNLQAQWNWQMLFPADRQPTVEEYIVTIAREQEAGREPPYLLDSPAPATAEDVEREIQLALDDAWERSRNDPAAKAYWQRLFPDGKKPSQEEFIKRLSQELSDRRSAAEQWPRSSHGSADPGELRGEGGGTGKG